MNWLAEAWRRLLFLMRGSQNDADLAEEMRLHVDLRAAERAAGGAPAEEARAAARRQFGNATLVRENSGEVWVSAWLQSLAQDVRYGVRTLRASPGFTLTAVLSLALGIGANTGIFSLLNAVLLRALPVEDPRQLMQVDGGGGEFTNPIWEQIRDHQQSFSGVLAYSGDRFDLTDGGESQFAESVWVSGDYFRVLGVPALRGRVLTADDDRHGGGKNGPVAVISYAFWQTHYAGDAAVVGKTIHLNRHPFEIVGVTPPWFRGLEVDRGFQVAIPIGCEPLLHTDESALGNRAWWWLKIIGRLAPGMTMEQAEARLKSLAPEVNRQTLPGDWDEGDQKEYLKRTLALRPAATGFSDTGAQYRRALWTLMAIVGLVLLIACANIANLLLARGTARQREISIRLAIGAGRPRVIRQLLTESLLLALAGAVGGMLFSSWGSRLLVRLISTGRNRLDLDVSADGYVLAFTSAVALLTAILFGIVPALRATSVAPNNAMKENARNFAGGTSRFGLGKTLVAVQVALSLVLLVGAGLFAGTLRNLLRTDIGFNPHNVLVVSAETQAKIATTQRSELYRTMLEKLRSIPGISGAAASLFTPISGMGWNQLAYPEGYTAKGQRDTLVWLNRVSPGYFTTMDTPLLAGRDFNDRDHRTSPLVMIINESAARKFFGNMSPVGRTIGLDVMGKPGVKDQYEVVGLVKDAKYRSVNEESPRIAYVVMGQDPDPRSRMTFELRPAGAAEGLPAAVRSAVAEVNPAISLEFGSLEKQVAESLKQQRVVALLSVFFGGLALLLAMIGLYGVTAYTVTRRQGEIGIRMALGASRQSVMWLVLRDVTLMLIAGTALGVAASLAAGRLVASLLYGMKPTDPGTLAAAALALATATAIAGLLPALRASRLDPTVALRNE